MLTKQSGLSNLQQELLKIYSYDLPEDELLEIRVLLANYFAEKTTVALDNFLDDHEIDNKTLVAWSKEHNRSENSN